MWHIPPKSAGRCTYHTRWSFHLKCGEDHDGCRQIHGTLKGSLGSHLSLCVPIHIEHYVLDSQRFEFLGDAFSVIVHAGPSEPNDLCYAFLVAYRNAKASGH
jgi:hypothetical protein